jgi:hypothetical protein
VFAGVGFCGYYLSRLATKHNDVTINKKKPYQFRTIGGTPKFLHTKAWTKQELRFNQVSGKWE